MCWRRRIRVEAVPTTDPSSQRNRNEDFDAPNDVAPEGAEAGNPRLHLRNLVVRRLGADEDGVGDGAAIRPRSQGDLG